jgi:hypothetical protein
VDLISKKKKEHLDEEYEKLFGPINYRTNQAHKHKCKIELVDRPQWKRDVGERLVIPEKEALETYFDKSL